MSGLKKSLGSAMHRCAKGAVGFVAPDELARKRLVSSYYAARLTAGNLARPKPEHTADELLSWRRTMGVKVEYSKEMYRGNSFYGAGRALREHAGLSSPVKACIEHGLYLGSYTNPLELDGSGLPGVITYGPVRAKHIGESSATPVLTVGPYIAYARDYLDEGQASLAKQMLGRTLLAFPSHSIDYIEKRFDVPGYIEHLKRRASEERFDTVLVSLYFSDVLGGAAELYERAGFKVVTSGYREDSNFLPRLRTFIGLADATSSNSMGTHIGYCTYFGRPHHVFQQDWEAVGVTQADQGHVAATNFAEGGPEEEREIVGAFAAPSAEVTARQLEVCERYWGFGCVRSPEVLAGCLRLLDAAFAGVCSKHGLAEALEKLEDKTARMSVCSSQSCSARASTTIEDGAR